jgi:hypothetical protein
MSGGAPCPLSCVLSASCGIKAQEENAYGKRYHYLHTSRVDQSGQIGHQKGADAIMIIFCQEIVGTIEYEFFAPSRDLNDIPSTLTPL